MKSSFILVLAAGLVLAGCGSNKQTNINLDTKPKLQVPKKVEPLQRNKGSLYSNRGGSLFSDKKDLQVGDIVLIDITEISSNKSEETRENDKTSTTQVGGGLFTPGAPDSTVGRIASNLNRLTNIGFQASSENEFAGTSTVESDDRFETYISVVIEEIYQNGNYFIKGSKETLINGEKRHVVISGIIRPYDIERDNIVQSDRIANLKVYYDKLGNEEALEKPWGTKAIETMWPF
jgi:flagellar L-ring protein precursor FlgH